MHPQSSKLKLEPQAIILNRQPSPRRRGGEHHMHVLPARDVQVPRGQLVLHVLPEPFEHCAGLDPTPYTLHLKPYTLHLKPYTLHLRPFTLHLRPQNLHLLSVILHPIPYTLNPVPTWCEARASIASTATRERSASMCCESEDEHPISEVEYQIGG